MTLEMVDYDLSVWIALVLKEVEASVLLVINLAVHLRRKRKILKKIRGTKWMNLSTIKAIIYQNAIQNSWFYSNFD